MHERAVRRITKYLTGTSKYVDLPDVNRRLTTCGIVYKPNIEIYMDCYVDKDLPVDGLKKMPTM